MPATRTFSGGTDFQTFAQDAMSAPAAPRERRTLLGLVDRAFREQIAGELAFCRDLAGRLLPSRDMGLSLAVPVEGEWTDRLEREFAENYRPVRAGQRWAAGDAEKPADPANPSGKALLVATLALWRAASLFRPLGRFFLAWRGFLFKAAVLALIALAGADLLAKWPDAPKGAPRALSAAPRDAWIDIARPFQLYELSAPLFAHEKRAYAARRLASGGGREDILTFGQFESAGDKPFLRLSVYRHGDEKPEETSFFVEMARRAAPLGLSVSAVRRDPDQPTRFGDIETAALTLSENAASRAHCRGFRLARAQPGLTIAGLACAAEGESMGAQDVACLLNRLDLLAAGSDRPLRDFFGAAEAHGVRGCAETLRRR